MSGRVLITGGSGFVGRAVLDRLVAQGREVRALTRSDASAAVLTTAGADPVRGDLGDGASLERAMAGCEVVYHVAGLNGFCLPDPSALTVANVEGTRAMVRAAGAAGVPRIVYTSSAATLGEVAGSIGSETSPHRGSFLSHYERSKYEAEHVAFAEARTAGVELVSVNPSSVQGPGRTRGTAKILIDALNGRLKLIVDSRMSIVDIADCAEGHLLAEERGQAGERYVLSGTVLTVAEAVALLGRISGRDERPRRIPPSAAVAMATAAEMIGRAKHRKPSICREMIRTILHGHAYDGGRAARELGLVYTPIEESLRRTVEWYVAEGLVTRSLPGVPAPA